MEPALNGAERESLRNRYGVIPRARHVIPSGGTRRFFLTFASRTSRPKVEESLFDLPSVSCHGACPERSRTGIPPQPVIPRKSRCFLSGRRGIAAQIAAPLAPNAVPLAMRHS